MQNNKLPFILRVSVSLAGIVILLTSCEGLLDIDKPTAKIQRSIIFNSDETASAAVTGMYAQMILQGNFASGSYQSLSAQTALSADDFTNFRPTNVLAIQFLNNDIHPDNSYLLNLWTSAYQVIYQANSIIESLGMSDGVSENLKPQLVGEAYFIRAFCHFNLVNLFGNIPLITSTDYRANTKAPRRPASEVYDRIVSDLLEAQRLMSREYPTYERVRPNQFAATALLARVYLYREEWSNAEVQSTILINESTYKLEEDLNNVFLSYSLEAIWQLRQTDNFLNTWEGFNYILTRAPSFSYLTPDLVNSFEDGDGRAANWIKTLTTGGNTFNYPFKYKIRLGGSSSIPPVPISEYSVVLRLAEQYLIRAEARVHLKKLPEAIADVDRIRGRAQLPLLAETEPTLDASGILLVIEKERRSELFTEWGHRWFDLKRTDRANEVLGAIKPGWSDTDMLYPIPDIEFSRNPNLGLQNPGY